MVFNFSARGITRDTCKLARISTLIKKNYRFFFYYRRVRMPLQIKLMNIIKVNILVIKTRTVIE